MNLRNKKFNASAAETAGRASSGRSAGSSNSSTSSQSGTLGDNTKIADIPGNIAKSLNKYSLIGSGIGAAAGLGFAVITRRSIIGLSILGMLAGTLVGTVIYNLKNK